MNKLKVMMSLLFVSIVATMNMQAAADAAAVVNQATEYQYGQQGLRADIFHFYDKYIDILLAKNLQLNDDEYKVMIAELQTIYRLNRHNNEVQAYINLSEIIELEFINRQMQILRNQAREHLTHGEVELNN